MGHLRQRNQPGVPASAVILLIGHPLLLAAIDELQTEAPPEWVARVGSFTLPPQAAYARPAAGEAENRSDLRRTLSVTSLTRRTAVGAGLLSDVVRS